MGYLVLMKQVKACGSSSIGALFLCSCLILAALPARAGDKAEARKHFKSGVSLLKKDDYGAAAAKFERSVKIYPTKSGIYNLANCYRTLHRYVEALEAFRRLLKDYSGELDDEMQADAKNQIAEINRTIGKLKIEIKESGAEVRLDDRLIGKSPLSEPVIVVPGLHEIVVSLDGYQSAERRLKVDPGARKRVRFDLKKIPTKPATMPEPVTEPPQADTASPSIEEENSDPPPELEQDESPRPIEEELQVDPAEEKGGSSPLFVAGLVGTLVGAAASGVFWGLGAKKKGDYEDLRKEYNEILSDYNPYYPSEEESTTYKKMKSAYDDASVFNNLAIVTTVITGVSLATMVVGAVLGSDREEKSAVEVSAAPGGVRLTF